MTDPATVYRLPQFTMLAVVVQELNPNGIVNHNFRCLSPALKFWERKTGLTWTEELGTDAAYPAKVRKKREKAKP